VQPLLTYPLSAFPISFIHGLLLPHLFTFPYPYPPSHSLITQPTYATFTQDNLLFNIIV
jgi:hypothetical protein